MGTRHDRPDDDAGAVPVLHEDERIVVLDKPTGLLSVPGIGPEKADCVASRVAAVCLGARIVHRLDRDTSGVLVMARDAASHRELSRQFHDREVSKVYLAIVAGCPEQDAGRIELPIRKDLDDPPRQMIDCEQGRAARTDWRVLERREDRAMLELRPLTGRSHQLRLHLREIGHPILGDDLYAQREQQAMAVRLMLHALSLSIVHPGSAAPMTFEAPCPFT